MTCTPRAIRFALPATFIVAAFAAFATGQTIRTVSTIGPGGPGPWATATTNLAAALAASQPGDEVWIAAGIYTPATSGNQTVSFVIPSGVRVFGGLVGTELALSDRAADPLSHPTILSGDQRGDDPATLGFFLPTTRENSFHVIKVSNTAATIVLDRLTVTHGTPSHYYGSTTVEANMVGGGLYATNAQLICSDCAFQDNLSGGFSAQSLWHPVLGKPGAGAYLSNCTAQFIRCTFARNIAGAGISGSCANGSAIGIGNGGDGGGAYIQSGSTTFRDCTFLANEAGSGGSGGYCTFSAGDGGPGGNGGAVRGVNASLLFHGCVFNSNRAGNGGAGAQALGGAPSANGSAGSGGAIYCTAGSLVVDRCTFRSNAAGAGGGGGDVGLPGGRGGALYLSNTPCRATSSLFASNRAGNGGVGGNNDVVLFAGGAGGNDGACWMDSASGPISISSCTFANNAPGMQGVGNPNGAAASTGGLEISSTSTSSIANCVFWNNTGAQLSASTAVLSSNCIRSQPPGPNGTNADPMFVNAATGDYHLLPNSPCINAGINAAGALPSDVDLDGKPRFVDACSIALAGPSNLPAVDIGAYEFQFAVPDCNADGICDVRQTSGTPLTPADSATGQRFGWSAALNADYAAIGARSKDTPRGLASGQVSVYDRAGSSYGSVSNLVPADGAPGDDFGNIVALSAPWLAVGARFADVGANADAGAAYIYRRDGLAWTSAQKLTPNDAHPGDEFAHGLAIDGTAIVAGALLGDAPAIAHTGAAYVFRLGPTSTWAQEAKLNAADAAANDGFGISVGISGSTAIIGAPYHTETGLATGAAYIFDQSGAVWTQTAKLLPPNGAAGDTFGELVAISGNAILINAPRHTVAGLSQAGSVYIYRRIGGVWTLEATLTSNSPRAGELFGFGLALDGDTAIIGGFARNSQVGIPHSGAAYVFRHISTQWLLASRVENPEPAANADFGYSVALGGGKFIAGAMRQPVRGVAEVGDARVFDLSMLDSNRNGLPDSCDIASGLLIDANGDGIPDAIPANTCTADFNGDSALNAQDIFDFLSAWFAVDPRADFNHIGGITAQDIFDYLAAWFAGC